MLHKLSLTKRILLVGILPLMCLTALLGWLRFRVHEWIYDTQRAKTQELVQVAWGIVDFYGNEVQAGRLTLEQAQAAAKSAVKRMRYGNGDYFWIHDTDTHMVMHPVNAALDGKELTDYRDPNGVRVFAVMNNVCSRQGEGLVEYMWPKPGGGPPLPKVSFVKLYKPWGWIVGSGIYMDEIRTRLNAVGRTILAMAGLVFLVSLGAALLLARSLSKALLRAVSDLMRGATRIAGAASQIATSSRTVGDGATQQTASLDESSVVGAQIQSVTQRNLETTRTVTDDVAKTGGQIAEANRKLTEMTACMRDIDAASDKIGKIIKVIDEIAFQTNILALNAAVEAARAGQAGLGFAVVADEVRNLAQRCSTASRETAVLIERSVSTSKAGVGKIADVAKVVNRITSSNAKVEELAAVVQRGSDEQARGMEQVIAAIARMEQVARTTAAAAHQSATASQDLSAQAESMRSVVRNLEAIVGATGASLEE